MTTTETEFLTTTDLARARGISTTAVRQGALRDPLGAPLPDEMQGGRGRPWLWNPERDDVRVYLMPPEELAAIAEKIKDREGSISAGARAVGVDRQTFVRALKAADGAQFGTQLKIMRAAGIPVEQLQRS